MTHKDDCIFCRIAKNEIPSEFLFENDNFFAILDKNQDIPGHALIISKQHYTNLIDMPTTLGTEMASAIKEVSEKILKNGAEGFNVFINNFPAGGQVVMHVHIHVLPRKKDDDLKLIG
jgi:histidine triad (HIT) family protein